MRKIHSFFVKTECTLKVYLLTGCQIVWYVCTVCGLQLNSKMNHKMDLKQIKVL